MMAGEENESSDDELESFKLKKSLWGVWTPMGGSHLGPWRQIGPWGSIPLGHTGPWSLD